MYKNNHVLNSASNMLEFDKVAGAFLGAACGDALGWPFEGHAKQRPELRNWKGNFQTWSKLSGGRFRPSTEQIAAGEYSDDTQLILALSRSILKLEHWWLHFALVELPFWTSYERGGGGATKRAATSWLTGVPPWHSSKTEQIVSYLSAGGNGVAMRVLPHCVQQNLIDDTYATVARNIVTDGVITHGHPRALVGALAYGYVLWKLLRKSDTLKFGELVDDLISSVSVWGSEENLQSFWPDWQATVLKFQPNYSAIWYQTVEEMTELLYIVKDALAEGVLSTDKSVLESLGALSPKTSGAGTVTCAAAVYFASRYAASPADGLLNSASAIGSDTDTLSSMTSGLLGALSGQQWLHRYLAELQDREYIVKVSNSLRTLSREGGDYAINEVSKTVLGDFAKRLSSERIVPGDRLPNDQNIVNYEDVSTVKNVESGRRVWRISTEDGQTLYIRTIVPKPKILPTPVSLPNVPDTVSAPSNLVINVGISLAVTDLARSLEFYQKALGMEVVALTSNMARFDNNLVVQKSEKRSENLSPITLFVQVTNIENVFAELEKQNIVSVNGILVKGRSKKLEVRDPDGYLVELYERTETSVK